MPCWFHDRMCRFWKLLSAWGPVLICMGAIFLASGDTQSKQHSSRLLEPFLRWIWPTVSQDQIVTAILLARKVAHMTEYGILALLYWRGFRLSLNPATPVSGIYLRSLAVVVLYAASDEYHQTFVPDRYGSVVDVLIDTTGAAIGLGLLLLWRNWANRSPNIPVGSKGSE